MWWIGHPEALTQRIPDLFAESRVKLAEHDNLANCLLDCQLHTPLFSIFA